MIIQYFYLKWDNLLSNLINVEKEINNAETDLLEFLMPAIVNDTMPKVPFSLKESEYFLPVYISNYDWIEFVKVPSNLNVYTRAIALDTNVNQNISKLSKDDQKALLFIQELTFSRWGPDDDMFINEIFEDFPYELFKHTSKIFASRTLSPSMIDSILEKWEKYKFIEKMDVFGEEFEHSLERKYILFWIDLLKSTKKKGNWGLLYNWY